MSRYALLGPESWRHLGYRRVSKEVAVVIVEHRPRGEMHERAGRWRAQVVAVIISSKWLRLLTTLSRLISLWLQTPDKNSRFQ